jgi:rubrerythrin
MKPLNTTPEEVLRHAIEDEVASRDLYTRMAAGVRDQAARGRLLKLADEQLQHRARLERRFHEVVGGQAPQVDLKPMELPTEVARFDLPRVLKFALEHEREAESNFRFLAERVPNTELGSLFLELAEMEWQHKTEIQNEYNAILDPEQFLLDM